MACGHGGRRKRHGGLKRVGSVMKRLSIYSRLGVSCCVIDLRTILTRIKNAGFFVRVFCARSTGHNLIAQSALNWERRRCEQGIGPIKETVIIS